MMIDMGNQIYIQSKSVKNVVITAHLQELEMRNSQIYMAHFIQERILISNPYSERLTKKAKNSPVSSDG